MFISTVGTNLVLVALSVYIFSLQSSAVSAAGVYIAQFLPVALFMPLAWKICNNQAPRFSLCWMETASAAITISIGIALSMQVYAAVYTLLMIRGFLEMTTKSSRNVCLKLIVDNAHISQANNFLMGSNFLGQAIGSLLGFVLINHASIIAIVMIDAITFLISAFICLRLPNKKIAAIETTHPHSLWKHGYQILTTNKRVLIAMFYLFMTVIVMQSFNQVARTWIPLAWLNLSNKMGALSELIGCIGIVIGLITVSLFFTGNKAKTIYLPLAFSVACCFMLLPFISTHPIISFSFYFIYMVLFEISLMLAMNQLLSSCQVEDTPSIMVIFYGTAFGGMTIITLLIATAADKWGLPIVTAIVMVCSLLIATQTERRIKKNFAMEKVEKIDLTQVSDNE